MNFCIADTFSDRLARPTADEEKTVKMTAFDLQLNPSKHGLVFESFHLAGPHPYD